MITCDTLVYKVFDIYGFKITASGIVFSLCFLISLLTEVYGYKLSVRAIWIMVFCQSLYVIILNLSAAIQPENNDIATHYYSLYHEFWRVMIGTGVRSGRLFRQWLHYFKDEDYLLRQILLYPIYCGLHVYTGRPVADSLSDQSFRKYTFMELVNIISTTGLIKFVVSIVLLPLAIALVSG